MKRRKMACAALVAAVALTISGCQNAASGTPAEATASESTGVAAPEETSVSESVAQSALPSSAAQEAPNTQFQWEVGAPEEHGMDGELLNAMHTAMEGTQINAAITVRGGVIVDEFYQAEYNEDSVFRFNSCSKSFTSALIGIAIGEGLVEGVEVSIAEYFPELAGTGKEAITIRHLLEHTSGLEWYEWGGSATSFWELNEAENWVEYVLERPMASAPGTTFTYSTGGTHLLAAILEQVTEESMLDYAKKHIFDPLGMDSVQWRADPQGILDGGNGIEMTARDAAKFGQLFLNGGEWNGRQLVPVEWVAESATVQVSRYGTNGSYGLSWWILPMGAANYSTYYALGAMGQFIVVVPELDLVVVIASSMPGDTNLPYVYISDYILGAVL